MGPSLKTLTAVTALTSYVFVRHAPELLPYSRATYIGTFVGLWCLGFSFSAFYNIILRPKFFSPLRHIPTAKGGSWWNGHFSRILAEPGGNLMREWMDTVPNDGIIRYLGLLNSEHLFIISPKALGEVLTAKSYDFVKPKFVSRILERILGVGVLLAEGHEHKEQRKNLLPAFAFRHIKDLYPVFWNKSREAALAMTRTAQADSILEVGDWASRVTLDIIGVAGMGQDFDAVRDPDALLSRTYRTVVKPSPDAQALIVLSLFMPRWLMTIIPLKRVREMDAAATVIKDVCRKLIRAKKEKLDHNQLTDVDILSVALRSGSFTDENLVDQMMTFLAAGHETTATAVTWAIYMLCLHPDMQSRLRQEVRERLPTLESSTTITSQQIDQLPYLNAICSEVLRYYPPVPDTIREAAKDTSICGHFVPKGTRVVLVPWANNRNKAQWGNDANKFNPDRWIPSDDNPRSANGGAPSNYGALTFLHGPRSCIGSGFAKAEFACLVAAWVGRFEFELQNDQEYDEKNIKISGGTTAKPVDGLYVRMKIVAGW